MKLITAAFLLIFAVVSCKESGQKKKELDPQKIAIVEDLQNRVKQSPDSASLRMQLINALDSLGMYKEAIAQTDSMILRDSLNNGLWFAKAQLLESNKDTAAAIQSYRRAIAIYPSIESQLSLANLYAETMEPKALLIVQTVSRMGLGREMDANCDFIAGVYNSRTGNHQQAIMLFDRAINNNYQLMEAYMEKGFVFYDTKKYTEALKVFQTAITVNNMYADAYYWQAKCYEALGNKDEALINYQRALGLDKELKEARDAIERLS
ncbi:MAG TPA: tetratricopeptide repeat protein [Segetibacter sp.]|jgi:tetratricopeptide (TPR) repeat protein